MPIIIAIAILVLGAICIAFDVPVWGALMIIIGLAAFLIVVVLIFESMKKKKPKDTVAKDTGAQNKESQGKGTKENKSDIIIGIIVFVVLLVFCLFVITRCSQGSCSSGSTTSYYIDENGNGKEDLGEGVWYEDEDGNIHFYD